MADTITVEVALRIRPLIESESKRGCKKCLFSIPEENQVQVIGTDKAFSYNYVFDENICQEVFYTKSIKKLVLKLFNGYNVTILAYGQTGSGKTHSIGTNYDGQTDMGVIPRAVQDIFNQIEIMNDHEFKVTVSFMELYQENLFDLLADKPREDCILDIREEKDKAIRIMGLKERNVVSVVETIRCLTDGSLKRATGATAMNSQSSRSHAVFTINIQMCQSGKPDTTTHSKFHLVDLAGSERSKKTNATGERFKEGVNINKGLLALGNVISALGDDKERNYINYRDSKLTRLLQDSLGGNSMTLMIACVSPADYNLDETISTLRYADRARKIKNKPIVNQDPKSAEIARLHQVIQQMRLEGFGSNSVGMSPQIYIKLVDDNNLLQIKNRQLNSALSSALSENTAMFERALLTQNANERLRTKLLELKETYNLTLNNLNVTEEIINHEPENMKNCINQFLAMKEIITDLNTEHARNEKEIQEHEYEINSPKNINKTEIDEVQPDVFKRQELHNQERLNLNDELLELNKALALKEQLASKIIANTNHELDYAAFNENQNKISALEKEKTELLQQLKNTHSNNVSSKLAEQRRKRVKELETQISELNRKVVELSRLIKIREKDEEKIKQLNKEIISMKTTKVKLIKSMRAEEQKFKAWKLENQRDLIKLKDKDRKQTNQMVKMKIMHDKQQTVLKRKVEEAIAINKRLKDALALQKVTQERRLQNNGKAERIQQWVTQELEVMASITHAEKSIAQLVEDRALLNQHLEELCNNLDSPDDHDPEVKEHIRQLNENIEIHSAQIADLQQKILDSDQDNKSKTRWETIQSMIDAKCALKQLFDLAAEIYYKSMTTECKSEELLLLLKQTEEKVNQFENKLKEQAKIHSEEISNIEKECEDKVMILLNQIHGDQLNSTDSELKEVVKIQAEELKKIDFLKDELNLYKEEVSLLRDKICTINSVANKTENIKKKILNTTISIADKDQIIEDLDQSLFTIDDDTLDPDWRKTPIMKRISNMKTKLNQTNQQGKKRNLNGAVKCSCRGSCSNKICGCRKLNFSCSEYCKCTDKCMNKDIDIARKLFNDPSESEDSFKRPRSLSDDDLTIPKKIIRSNEKLKSNI